MGDFLYTFVSSAYFVERSWGYGTPRQGMELLGELAHGRRIPVTWLVSPRSAREMAEPLTGWHQEFGDEVGVYLGAPPEARTGQAEREYFVSLDYEGMREKIEREARGVVEALPWARVTVAGGGYRSNTMVAALEDLGFDGLWGHCWEQAYVDNITDRGAPWGFYYASREAFKAPACYPGKVVACEWTARDLNKAFRTGKPEVYSTDPNDADNNRLCTATDISYWRAFLDQYRRNTAWNDFIPFLQHQEAHEMETGIVHNGFTQETVDRTAAMLERLFAYVASLPDVQAVSLPRAVAEFKRRFLRQPATYMLFEDIPVAADPRGPWPEVLVYCDDRCQLFFDRDQPLPIAARNYLAAADTEAIEFAAEESLPEFEIERSSSAGIETINVCARAERPIRYGLALWGDYPKAAASAEARQKPDANVALKEIGGQVLLATFDLPAGRTNLSLRLPPP